RRARRHWRALSIPGSPFRAAAYATAAQADVEWRQRQIWPQFYPDSRATVLFGTAIPTTGRHRSREYPRKLIGHRTPQPEWSRSAKLRHKQCSKPFPSFDSFIGKLLELRWYIKAECRGGLEVDHEIEPLRALYRQVAWVGTMQDFRDVIPTSSVHL